jgi:hypothetical protein
MGNLPKAHNISHWQSAKYPGREIPGHEDTVLTRNVGTLLPIDTVSHNERTKSYAKDFLDDVIDTSSLVFPPYRGEGV